MQARGVTIHWAKVYDFKRPESGLMRALLRAMMPRSMPVGVQDLGHLRAYAPA